MIASRPTVSLGQRLSPPGAIPARSRSYSSSDGAQFEADRALGLVPTYRTVPVTTVTNHPYLVNHAPSIGDIVGTVAAKLGVSALTTVGGYITPELAPFYSIAGSFVNDSLDRDLASRYRTTTADNYQSATDFVEQFIGYSPAAGPHSSASS